MLSEMSLVIQIMRYLLALMVLWAANQLILNREKPIEPLWITYHVFLTLNFDNLFLGRTVAWVAPQG